MDVQLGFYFKLQDNGECYLVADESKDHYYAFRVKDILENPTKIILDAKDIIVINKEATYEKVEELIITPNYFIREV